MEYTRTRHRKLTSFSLFALCLALLRCVTRCFMFYDVAACRLGFFFVGPMMLTPWHAGSPNNVACQERQLIPGAPGVPARLDGTSGSPTSAGGENDRHQDWISLDKREQGVDSQHLEFVLCYGVVYCSASA